MIERPRNTVSAGRPRGGLARSILAELGGVAGSVAIATRMEERLGRRVLVREVRDSFRNVHGVRKLGAGYYAERADVLPVLEYVAGLQASSARAWKVEEIVATVLAAYPHGDADAIRSWLEQLDDG